MRLPQQQAAGFCVGQAAMEYVSRFARTVQHPHRAAAQALKEAGKSNSIKVVGLSLPDSMRQYIKEGVTQNITLWSPQRLGYLTVALAKNLLDGEFPRDQQEIPNVGNIRVKDNVVIMGVPIVFTKENIDQYDF